DASVVVGVAGGTVEVVVTTVLAVVVLGAAAIVVVVGGATAAGSRPASTAATASRTNRARARVASMVRWTPSTYAAGSLATAVAAQSPAEHRGVDAHHVRGACEYAACGAWRRSPGRACDVRNSTGRPPARRIAPFQCATQVDSRYRPASFVPSATTTTSPSPP